MTRNSAAAALVLVLAGCGGNDEPAATSAATTPSPAAASALAFPSVDRLVPVPGGHYRVPRRGAVSGYDVTVPEGWGVEHGEVLVKNPDSARAINVEVWALSEIAVFDDACHGKGVKRAPTSDSGELISALGAQRSGPAISTMLPTSFAGWSALRFQLTAPDDPAQVSDCRVPGALQVWDGFLVLFPHEPATVYVVDGRTDAPVFVTRVGDDASAADRQELRALLRSIRLAQPS